MNYVTQSGSVPRAIVIKDSAIPETLRALREDVFQMNPSGGEEWKFEREVRIIPTLILITQLIAFALPNFLLLIVI